MPTGYTARVMETDISFRQFALSCARAFGALIEMRDDDMDAPIPEEFKPSPYYAEHLAEARAEYGRLAEFDADAQAEFGSREKQAALKSQREYLAKSREENASLKKMLEEVEAWAVPSPDHEKLKEFMIQQLTISFHDLKWSEDSLQRIEEKQPIDFYNEALERALKNIPYYQKELLAEQSRVNERNEWLKQLRESLGTVTV